MCEEQHNAQARTSLNDNEGNEVACLSKVQVLIQLIAGEAEVTIIVLVECQEQRRRLNVSFYGVVEEVLQMQRTMRSHTTTPAQNE